MKYIGFIFILLWSSGYISSSIGLMYTNPLSFITLRVVVALFVFILLNFLFAESGSVMSRKDIIMSLWVGLFIQFLYPVLFSYSLSEGISPAMLTVVLGLQPVVTLMISRGWTSKIQIGAIIGCVLGTVLLSVENMSLGTSSEVNMLYAVLSLLGITFGTAIQKRYCSHIPIQKTMGIQCLSALLALVPTTLLWSEFAVEWTAPFLVALLWQSIAISSLASVLLIHALKSGTVTNVSTYFSCVPACTSVLSYLILDSELTIIMGVGIGFICVCTYLVQNSQST
ncbi:DMT family transporter [Vibrio splendidus]